MYLTKKNWTSTLFIKKASIIYIMFQWYQMSIQIIEKNEDFVKEALAYCQSFFDSLHTWKGGARKSLFNRFITFWNILFGLVWIWPTDRQTDTGMKAPCQSLKNRYQSEFWELESVWNIHDIGIGMTYSWCWYWLDIR